MRPGAVVAMSAVQSGTVNAEVIPPSSGTAAAVMNPASSLARKATVAAASSRVPKRPIGQWTSRLSILSPVYPGASAAFGSGTDRVPALWAVKARRKGVP
jgi:hypothetical protein